MTDALTIHQTPRATPERHDAADAGDLEISVATESAASAAAGVAPVDDGGAPRRSSRRHLLLVPAAALAASACDKKTLALLRKLRGRTPTPTTLPPTTVPPTTAPPTTAPPTTAPPVTLPPGSGSGLTATLVVDKLTFGPRPGLVAEVAAAGPAAWVDRQLAPAGLADAEGLLAGSSYATLRNSNLQNYAVQDSDGGQDLLFDQLDHATLLRAIRSERQLYEVMCDFWANHFNIWRRHTWMGFLRTRDLHDVVRANALGKFSDMLSASAHSTAMLDYLDNLPNDASSPGGVNQNYARELMELHSLGIIGGQHVYTEDDVQAVALILSGWSLQWNDGPGKYDFVFDRWQHTNQAVTAFGGAFTAPAHADRQGYADGVRLLDFLAHHPSTARYIAWKLCRRFVGDDPPMSLVDSAAAVFTASDTAIAPTLRHIIMSPEFAASGGQKVRRPLEHVVACLRATGAQVPTDPQGNGANVLRYALDAMGQPLHERVTPDGYPDIATYWVSSDSLLQRWAFAGTLARNGLDWWEGTDRITVDLAARLPSPLPSTAGALIAALATSIANITIPTGEIADLCGQLGVTPSSAASTVSANAPRLAGAVGLILSHPSFQRR